MAKDVHKFSKFIRMALAAVSILLLLCLAFYYPYCKGKNEFHDYLTDISQLEPGEYTVTIGVYGVTMPDLDICDPNIQKLILHELSLAEYNGIYWILPPMTSADHVYWITFFSSEPFVTQTWEIGGEKSRNCVLGKKHRLRITNTNALYTLLKQIEAG